jgi:tRNA (guanine37-N1)-methyltransferase
VAEVTPEAVRPWRVDIITLFPAMFAPLDESILKRAADAGRVVIRLHDLRTYTTDRHHTADDYPFGGGAGLVLLPGPIFDAVAAVRAEAAQQGWAGEPEIVLTAAQGTRFTQAQAERLARQPHLIFICGHYEGVDARVEQHLATRAISIGDYVLTGGELAAMVVVDATARLVPGVLGAAASLAEESMTHGLLEYPQYTRPADFRGWAVPPVLLSGDHGAIARWRRAQSLQRTFAERPDLLARTTLTRADAPILAAGVPLPEAAGATPEFET